MFFSAFVAVDLLGRLQDVVGLLGLALPEQGLGQALVGDQVLGRELQQLPEARLGLLPVLAGFRHLGNAAQHLLFHGPLAFGVRVRCQQLLGLVEVHRRLGDPPLLQGDVAENDIGFRIAGVVR